MSRNGKVIVAMSGGVDSSVAAALLREQGYDCVGVFMRVGAAAEDLPETVGQENADAGGTAGLSDAGDAASSHLPTAPPSHPEKRRLRHGCCSATDALDARVIAGRLGIPFYALNFRPDFDQIINYFVDEYGRGRTPNPCVQCNIHLKFGKLLRYADMMDAEFIATGHYARVLRDAGTCEGGRIETAGVGAGGVARLARAVNLAKDQSYVLFGIRRDAVGRCLFPIGGIADKAEVRRMAAGLGLRTHDKPDSQEICFVPNNDYRELLARRRPELIRPGEFRDATGRVLGQHDGVAGFTIGQRRGLGIAAGRPVFVTHLDVLSNTVTIGERDELLAPGLIAEQMNWLTDTPPVGVWMPAAIKIRHMHTPAPGRFRVLADGRVEARFDEPQSAVTPGQAAVLYEGEVVLGGGWIERESTAQSEPRAPASDLRS